MTESRGAVLERLIVGWAGRLKPGVVDVTVEDAPMERVVRLKPTAAGGAAIVVRIGSYGGCGIYAGHGFGVEETRDGEWVLSVCEAVRRGLLRDRVSSWHGHLVKAQGVLRLPAGDTGSTFFHRWWLLPLGPRTEEIQYTPWD